MKNKIVCLVGMCGSGKSKVADFFISKNYQYIRFGQITLDEVKRKGLKPNEENERPIREGFRKKYGQGAFAVLNIPKFDEALKNGNVVGDGLYSWEEYKILKEKYGNNLFVIAIYASPEIRYKRLANRATKYRDDPKMKYRSFGPKDAKDRDYAEIENSDKGGPIAMADYTIINEGNLEELREKILVIFNKIIAKI